MTSETQPVDETAGQAQHGQVGDSLVEVDEGVDLAAPPRLPSEITMLRRAQQCLLGWGVIYHSKHPDLYKVLQINKIAVINILGELGLSMTIDETYGVALLRVPQDEHADEEVGPHPMVRRSTLTLLDTLVALMLRDYYKERQSLTDITIQIDIETLYERMQPYMPLFAKSESLFQKKINGAVDRFSRKWHMLAKVRGDDGMYEITPVIAIVVNAEWLKPTLDEYRKLLERKRGEAGTVEVSEDDESERDE